MLLFEVLSLTYHVNIGALKLKVAVNNCLLPLKITNNNCGCHLTELEIFLPLIFCATYLEFQTKYLGIKKKIG